MNLVQALVSLPLPLLILAMLGVPLLFAVMLGQIIQAIFTPAELAESAAVGARKYAFIVEVYAVVAALTLVGSWEIYQTARDNLQREASGLYMLAIAVPSYADPLQAGLREAMYAALRGYANAVVLADWPHMQAGDNRSGSDMEFQALARVFLDSEPVTAAQQALAQNVVGWIAQISDGRIARLSANSRSFGSLIWLLVLTLSVAVISFQWFVGSSARFVHHAMGAVIALVIGGVLAVSARMAFPFSGDPAFLTPSPFIQLLEVGG